MLVLKNWLRMQSSMRRKFKRFLRGWISQKISKINKYNEDGTINRSNRDPWKYPKTM